MEKLWYQLDKSEPNDRKTTMFVTVTRIKKNKQRLRKAAS